MTEILERTGKCQETILDNKHYNGLLVASKDLESDIATLYRYDALGRQSAVSVTHSS